MSFSTAPKEGPLTLSPGKASITLNAPQVSSRERALTAFKESAAAQVAPQAQEQHPVANPSQVSPEELSVVSPPSKLVQNLDSEGSNSPESSGEAPKKPEDPLSSHYAQLARKERALRAKVQAQEQAYKARELQLKAQEDALKAKEAQYSTGYVDKSKLQQDTLSVLNELGISYDQLTNMVLNAPKPEELAQKQAYDRIQAEIKAIRDEQEQARQAVQDQQKQAYTQAVAQIRSDVKNLVNSDPEYSVIKSTNSVEDVVELIEKTFNKDGILLTVDEAAKEVEDFLTEEAERLYSIEKIQKRIEASRDKNSQPQQQQQNSGQQTQKPQSLPSKTLTNSVTSSKRMSAKERAMAAFNGQKAS